MREASFRMTADIIKADPSAPVRAFSRCRDVIRSGGVIAYPTETFYGLGVDPRNEIAVKKLFAIKGRPKGEPILLVLKDAAAVHEWAAKVSPEARLLMERFWPGPLTIVFKARPEVPSGITSGTHSIGLRVPGSTLTLGLLEFLGNALTGTSANRSGERSPRTAGEVLETLGEHIDLVLDGGLTPGTKPSSVIDTSVDPPRILREGAIAMNELQAVLREVS